MTRAVPFIVGGGVATVVALLVVFAVAGGSDEPATVAAAPAASTGGQAPSTEPIAASSTAERARRLALGQRLVRPADERPTAETIRLQTASYADGSVFDLAEERGNVVVLYFMAAWCPTCIAEAQALAQIHEQYAGEGVRVLILDVDTTEDEDDLAGFRSIAGNGAHLWAMDPDDQVARTYEVLSLDTTIFIDREGRIAYMDGSPTSYDVLAAVIEALL